MKPVGKPDAGNPHVRFDERGGETERFGDTAPLLDSTAKWSLSAGTDCASRLRLNARAVRLMHKARKAHEAFLLA